MISGQGDRRRGARGSDAGGGLGRGDGPRVGLRGDRGHDGGRVDDRAVPERGRADSGGVPGGAGQDGPGARDAGRDGRKSARRERELRGVALARAPDHGAHRALRVRDGRKARCCRPLLRAPRRDHHLHRAADPGHPPPDLDPRGNLAHEHRALCAVHEPGRGGLERGAGRDRLLGWRERGALAANAPESHSLALRGDRGARDRVRLYQRRREVRSSG